MKNALRVFGATLGILSSQPLLANGVSETVAPVRTITFPGLPTVTYDLGESHLSAVRVDNRPILVIVSAPDGTILSMEAPGRWSWHFSSGGGNIHHRFAVTGGHGQYDADIAMNSPQIGSELPVFLETVREELGLPDAWRRATAVVPVGSVGYDVEDSGTHGTVMRLRESSEGVRIGLSSSGEPLFYDLRLPVSVPDAQRAAVPTRLIVSHSGRIQLALAAPRHNAITSVMWSTDPHTRGVTYQHFALDVPANARVRSLMMWQCGAYYSCYDDPTVGYTCWWQDQYCYTQDPPPSPDPGVCSGDPSAPSALTCGGGPRGGGPRTDPVLVDQQQQYSDNGCDTPALSSFINSSQYNTGTYWLQGVSWSTFSNGNKYAIVTPALRNGWDSFVNYLDNQIPTVTGGYRSIQDNLDLKARGINADTCSDHSYGGSLDISMKDASGNFSCNSWNLMAAAGAAAGAWVEPWDAVKNNPHLHLTWGSSNPDRQPGDNYGTCTGYP